MKEMTLEQFSKRPKVFIKDAQREQVLVTQNGEPLALIVGIKNKDEEDWKLETSRDFWRMIEERRKRPTVPLHGAKSTLFPK